MRGWRGRYLLAKVTPILVASYVWLVASMLLPPAAFLLVILLGLWMIAGWNSRPMLWARFGVRPATGWERSTVLASVVAVESMRGRGEPTVWVGRWLREVDCVVATPTDLVVSSRMLQQMAAGSLSDQQFGAMVSWAKGQTQVWVWRPAAAIEVFALPWLPVSALLDFASGVKARHALLRGVWSLRWVVFAIAAVQTANEDRWGLTVGVVVLAAATWSTSWWNRRWAERLRDLGDDQVRIDGFGGVLASMIRRPSSTVEVLERADRLESAAKESAR